MKCVRGVVKLTVSAGGGVGGWGGVGGGGGEVFATRSPVRVVMQLPAGCLHGWRY